MTNANPTGPAQQPQAGPQQAPRQTQQPFSAVPPTGQVPPANPYGAPTPVPPAPQNVPGMPLLYLTGGMKLGWAALGFFMGPIAILIAWLVNASSFPQVKSDAVKFTLFGFLAQFVIGILLVILFGVAACSTIGAATAGMSGAGYYSDYYL